MKTELTLKQQVRLARGEPLFTNPTCKTCQYVGSAAPSKHGEYAVYDLFVCPNHKCSSTFGPTKARKTQLLWLSTGGTSDYLDVGNSAILLKEWNVVPESAKQLLIDTIEEKVE